MRNALALTLTLCLLTTAQAAPGDARRTDSLTDNAPKQATLVPIARLTHKAIAECSGFAYTGGAFWCHNDSGAEAVLYRSETPDFKEPQVFEVPGADSVDWEELTVFEGDILVCDTGDNRRLRENVTLYRVRYDAEKKTISRTATYNIKYPDGAHDCEGVCVVDGKVHMFVKNRGEKVTAVFRCDELKDKATITPVAVGDITLEKDEQITAADISGNDVLLLSYTRLYQYKKDKLSGAPVKSTLIGARQCEAMCFKGPDLFIANEQRDVYQINDFLTRDYDSILPPIGKTTLNLLDDAVEPDGTGDAWANFRVEIPLQFKLEDEHLHWAIAGDCLMLHAKLRYRGEFQGTRANRVGSGLLLTFGKERRVKFNAEDVQLFIGDNGQTGLDAWRIDATGDEPVLAQVEGARFKGKVKSNVMEFEAALPLKLIFGEKVPEAFLFNTFGISMHTEDEVVFSGPDYFAYFRPYLWGDVTVKR